MRPEDKGRRFIISYRLADDMIKIFEPPVRNSGIISGTFLERTRVTMPGSTPENPKFYGPQVSGYCVTEASGGCFKKILSWT